MPIERLNGADIYYEEYGSQNPSTDPEHRPALVLAHGVGGNHAIWFNQLDTFSRSHRVVTFDHRGFGNSSDPQGLGRSAHALDLLALLDHLDIQKAALVGQSMGGGTCIGLTALAPERVAALVMADSLHAIQLPGEARATMHKAQEATAMLSQIERVLGKRMRQEEAAKATLYSQINSFNATNRHTLKGKYPRLVSPKELGESGVPILFIAGEEDVLFPVSAIRAVQGQVKGSEYREIPGVGHSAFYEDPASFNRLVLEFLHKA
jgi:pimeloyl-ACP methyl ester carboxylesterase